MSPLPEGDTVHHRVPAQWKGACFWAIEDGADGPVDLETVIACIPGPA